MHITFNGEHSFPRLTARSKATISSPADSSDWDKTATPSIVDALGLAQGATWGDVAVEIVRLKKLNAEALDQQIEDVVTAAIEIGADGSSKLWKEERDMAVGIGREQGLGVLLYFIKGRQPITPAMRLVAERLSDAKARRDTGSSLATIDDEQRRINKQVGLTDAAFLKYNSLATIAATPVADVQQAMNRQMHLSDETFRKYAS